jgi:hypothetical protein
VVEYIGEKNALFAIANRASHPAVVTIDTVTEITHKLLHI